MSTPVFIPAPPDLAAVDQYVHAVSGRLISVRVVGFQVLDGAIEALTWPAIAPGSGWEKIEDLGNGYVGAAGRQALNAQDLATGIRVGRPVR